MSLTLFKKMKVFLSLSEKKKILGKILEHKRKNYQYLEGVGNLRLK
jgi:hypothetical protein